VVETVRTWPEYKKLLELIREKVVDVDRYIEFFRELYWQGNVFNDWKRNGISLCFVLTYIKFHDTE